MKRKKGKQYKLGERAREVNRLNMLQGSYPEEMKVGQPSFSFIRKRVEDLRKANY